jgi:hypothetical protein
MSDQATDWRIDNDYGVLRDVLLGKPDYYKWVEAGPLIGRTLQNMHKTGASFDFELAQQQHREMVRIYEGAGVTCHYLESDPVLHRNFFARDSSAMTPWGALICHMQLKCRRADYYTTIKFYQEHDIPIWRYATAGHFEGGDFVILEPGSVLIGYCGERSEQEGAEQVAEFVRAEGWDVEVAPIPALFVHNLSTSASPRPGISESTWYRWVITRSCPWRAAPGSTRTCEPAATRSMPPTCRCSRSAGVEYTVYARPSEEIRSRFKLS